MDMLRTIFLIGASLLGLLSPASAAVFPLRTADNGRFLIDQKGEPFLVVGDTAWSLIAQLSDEDIDRYLDDRQRRGFNSIIVNLIEHRFSSNPPMTRAGLPPFAKTGDFSMPNPAYFDFAHKVVEKANDRRIVVWLFPTYLGYGGGDDGFFREMQESGRESLRSYGRFVGKRFKDLPNIVWVMGGDFTPKQEDQWVVAEVAEGICEEDSTHLMTGHGSPEHSAVVAFGEEEWLTVNSVYSYEKTLLPPGRDGISTPFDPSIRSYRVHVRGRAQFDAPIKFAAKPTGRYSAGPAASSLATTRFGISMGRACFPPRLRG